MYDKLQWDGNNLLKWWKQNALEIQIRFITCLIFNSTVILKMQMRNLYFEILWERFFNIFHKTYRHWKTRAVNQSKLSTTSIYNGNRTSKWRPIRSVIIRVINKIGRPRSGSLPCLINHSMHDYRSKWTTRSSVIN